MTFLGLIAPQGSVKYLYLSTSLRVFVFVSVWEVDCVFQRTHAYAHTLGVFMLVYETKLCLYAQKVSPDPSLSVSLGTDPPSALLCISIFLSLAHALLILFLCSLTRGTVLNYPLCTVKCTSRSSFLQNLPLNHCSDNRLLSTSQKWVHFGSSELSWINVFLISHCTFSNNGTVNIT